MKEYPAYLIAVWHGLKFNGCEFLVVVGCCVLSEIMTRTSSYLFPSSFTSLLTVMICVTSSNQLIVLVGAGWMDVGVNNQVSQGQMNFNI